MPRTAALDVSDLVAPLLVQGVPVVLNLLRHKLRASTRVSDPVKALVRRPVGPAVTGVNRVFRHAPFGAFDGHSPEGRALEGVELHGVNAPLEEHHHDVPTMLGQADTE